MEVLIVDNDAVNRLVTSVLLKKIGCSPVGAEDEHEAMNLLQRTPFDLIIMDLDASVTAGEAIAVAVRQSGGPNALTPMIGISSCSEWGSRTENDPGMDGYMEKPYDFSELVDTIGRIAGPGAFPRQSSGVNGWWWNMSAVLHDGEWCENKALSSEIGAGPDSGLPVSTTQEKCSAFDN